MTISTLFVEEASLDLLKIAGMILCVMGVATHSVIKAIKLQGIILHHITSHAHKSLTLFTYTIHTCTDHHSALLLSLECEVVDRGEDNPSL